MAPSYSRGRDETTRTEPDASLEPARPDFPCRASKETNKFEPTFELRGEMDEFRRLKAAHPSASSRELAEFQVFAKAVAAHREDGRGSEDRGEDNSEDTGDDRRRGRHSSCKDFKDSRERAPVADLLRDPGGMRKVIVSVLAQISLAETADVAVTGVEKRNTKIVNATRPWTPRA